MQSAFLDPGHCLWGFKKMEEKIKRGVHLIVRVIDFKKHKRVSLSVLTERFRSTWEAKGKPM